MVLIMFNQVVEIYVNIAEFGGLGELYNEVSWVLVFSYFTVKFHKIRLQLLSSSLKDLVAILKDNHPIKDAEKLPRWLMDSSHYSHSFLGLTFQHIKNSHGC